MDREGQIIGSIERNVFLGMDYDVIKARRLVDWCVGEKSESSAWGERKPVPNNFNIVCEADNPVIKEADLEHEPLPDRNRRLNGVQKNRLLFLVS